MPNKQCTCGNDEFAAHQQVYTDVVVDGNNLFIRGGKPYESETPYGPYTCTKCYKEYDETEDIPECVPHKRRSVLRLEIDTIGMTEQEVIAGLNRMMENSMEKDLVPANGSGQLEHYEFAIESKEIQ